MGAVGVFVLLCINPLVFTALLLIGGVAYWVLVYRGPPSGDNKPRKGGSLLPVLALGTAGALAVCASDTAEDETGSAPTVRSAPRPEVIVLRTPGGLLEVSSVRSNEMFDATMEHSIFGVKLGGTVPRIRVPVVYRYHVELAPEWRVVRSDEVFTIVVPRIRPTLPVAVDLAGIQKDVAGAWLLLPFTGGKDLDLLERTITAKLAQKAASRDYVERQREAARTSVREFVVKWLITQTRWKHARYEDVRVLFEDEPASAITPVVI